MREKKGNGVGGGNSSIKLKGKKGMTREKVKFNLTFNNK
jgi:hypothetical protein